MCWKHITHLLSGAVAYNHEYPADKPYSKLDQSQLETCLAKGEVAAHSDPTVSGTAKEDTLEMTSAIQRWVNRDFSPDGESMANHDRSIFQTFEWLQSRFPKKTQDHRWAAIVHIAKQGDPIWGDRARTNLGSFIAREYGKSASARGFSALDSSFAAREGKFPAIPFRPQIQ